MSVTSLFAGSARHAASLASRTIAPHEPAQHVETCTRPPSPGHRLRARDSRGKTGCSSCWDGLGAFDNSWRVLRAVNVASAFR
eukprot:1154959-Pleurochrysis_carterae.AAC.1